MEGDGGGGMTKPDELIAAARAAKRAALDELAGKRLLASFGISVPKSVVVQDAAAAAAACGNLKLPLVLKVVSPDILHKSDAGGVKVGLESVVEVGDAVRAMMKHPAI